MQHVRLAGIEERVLEAVTQAYTPDHPRHIRWHLASVLEEYAKAGDDRAWQALFAAAESREEAAWSTLEALVPRGILWLAIHVLPTLPAEDLYQAERWRKGLPEDAPPEIVKALDEAQLRLDAYHETLAEARAQKTTFDPDVFLATPPAERPRAEGITFAGNADAGQLYEAALQFLEAQDVEAIQVFYRIFSRRAFPLDPRLLVARADEEETGWAFRAAMSQIDSQIVHDYAARLLAERPLPWHAIWALEKSFRKGDEPILLAALRSVENAGDDALHHHVQGLMNILEWTDEIDWPPFYTWVYEESPCSHCRRRLVRWSVEDDNLPNALRQELRYDVDPQTRKLVIHGIPEKEEEF